jgi:hypothetical protein
VFCTRVESELAARQFESLDALERELRDPNVRFLGGNSQLYHFYGAAEKRQLLEQWLAAVPQSVAAQIAASHFWSNAGWTARGGSYSNKVTAEQWQSLASDLDRAKSALINVGPPPSLPQRNLAAKVDIQLEVRNLKRHFCGKRLCACDSPGGYGVGYRVLDLALRIDADRF